jgi:hypothetical protein
MLLLTVVVGLTLPLGKFLGTPVTAAVLQAMDLALPLPALVGQALLSVFTWCPDCILDVEGLSDSPWMYLAAILIQNLNSMFNTIYNGIDRGQLDFSDLTDNLADNFFPLARPTKRCGGSFILDPCCKSRRSAVLWLGQSGLN